ncbi:MAG: methylmalonyl Co-A mutase-associated GTPase MeaB [Pseudomonadales bacterium]|nr:methylmalonyl Co-A mutase-associated GTPase MeaB [Pseudomonadales bacterium]
MSQIDILSKHNIDKLIKGDRRSLAKAITLVESTLPTDREKSQQLLEKILPHSGNSMRVGITGIPGVGKSTFIETFGLFLLSLGKKVAVLAVDPSSPVAGGSILGDKTRMEYLSREEHAYIRPSPSGGALGGVAHKTRETMLLCEAAGYDVILVETVGVGQSEYEVAGMVDFFLVLMLPNAGDELQGIKKGILELADSIVINKADGESINMAQQTKRHYLNAFQLLQHGAFWAPKVVTCSALENENIEDVWNMVVEYFNLAKKHRAVDSAKSGESMSSFDEKRANQNKAWMWKLIREMLDLRLKQNSAVQNAWPSLEASVVKGELAPYSAAKQIMDVFS